ncbi:MAG: TM2 domain-containing protein [Bacteroidota bacterium]
MEIVDESGNALPQPQPQENKKLIAGIFAILLGPLGIHKFILGYQKEGIIMLLVSVLTCGIGAGITGLIGLIEGIIYLTKTDEEFYQMYQVQQKTWF